jgi:hypothetical protein
MSTHRNYYVKCKLDHKQNSNQRSLPGIHRCHYHTYFKGVCEVGTKRLLVYSIKLDLPKTLLPPYPNILGTI